jgi:type VI secretion system protein ImpA
MASPPLLDFDTLLAPIDGANPAGETCKFRASGVAPKLDEARKEVNPNHFARDDPRRPEQPQLADWPGIEELARDTLVRSRKDLMVAARLTEALVKRHGFHGLRDGLRLMRRLTQECWDWVHPVIEDGDLEMRATPFNWLDDELLGAKFPYTLRTVPLTKAGDEQAPQWYGWQHWKDAQEARGPVTAEAFDQAVVATPHAYCQQSVEDLAASAEELSELAKVLSEKMGDGAPALSQMRKAVLECQELAQHLLRRKGPPPASAAPAAAPAADAGASAPPVAAPAARRPLTREDVLNRLADASALLLDMEPQSPIAYMIQRAVRLARLPLPDLMRVLIRDAGVLGQLDRDLDLGIEKSEAAKANKPRQER